MAATLRNKEQYKERDREEGRDTKEKRENE